MKKLSLLLFSFFVFSFTPSLYSNGKKALVPIKKIDIRDTFNNWILPINLEHATTKEEIQWGLMGRHSLKEHHGMTFTFDSPTDLRFWMFNCFTDLSVAYLDENKVIREVHYLKAYPNKMDPSRAVTNIKEFSKYPFDDPITQFFLQRGRPSAYPSTYALEMPGNWFFNFQVFPGDLTVWNPEKPQGFICHTINLSYLTPKEESPLILEVPGDFPHSVWIPSIEESRDIAFINKDWKILEKQTLKGGKNLPEEKIPVFYSKQVCKYILLAPKGWLSRNLVENRVTVDNDFLILEKNNNNNNTSSFSNKSNSREVL